MTKILIDARYRDSLNKEQLRKWTNLEILILEACELPSCSVRKLEANKTITYLNIERALTKSKETYKEYSKYCMCSKVVTKGEKICDYLVGDESTVSIFGTDGGILFNIPFLVSQSLKFIRQRSDYFNLSGEGLLTKSNEDALFENTIFVHQNITTKLIEFIRRDQVVNYPQEYSTISLPILLYSGFDLVKHLITSRISRLFKVKWRVIILEVDGRAIRPIKTISTSGRNFIADPFLYTKNGELFLFAEKWDEVEKKGEIVYFRETEKFLKENQVIKEEFHLSYPFVFEEGNQVYIFPETHASGNQYVYMATEFPNTWTRLDVTLENGPAIDPNIFKHEGKLHLLYSTKFGSKNNGNNSIKHVLSSDFKDFRTKKAIEKPDLSAPGGPRNGGYVAASKYYRVAQRSSFNCYGKSISVESLDFQDDESIIFHQIVDSRKFRLNRVAIHHLSNSGDVYTLDIKSSRLSLHLKMREIKKFVKTVHRKINV